MNDALFKQWFHNNYLRKQVMKYVPLINASQFTPSPLTTESLSPSFNIKNFGTAANLCKHKCFKLLQYILKLPENVRDQLRRDYGLHCDMFMFETVTPFLQGCNDYNLFLYFYQSFPNAFTYAKRYGNVTSGNNDFIKRSGIQISPFDAACMASNLDILKHLSQDGFQSDAKSGTALENVLANKNFSMEVVKYLVEDLGLRLVNPNARYNAIDSCRMDIIEYIYDRVKCHLDPVIKQRNRAHQVSNIEIVKFICEQDDPTTLSISSTANHNHLEAFIYLSDRYPKMLLADYIQVLKNACKSGALGILTHIHDHFSTSVIHSGFGDLTLLIIAVTNNHLDIVKYLTSINVGTTSTAMDKAAILGYYDILEFLHHNRTEGCSYEAMNGAVKNGHLEIIKFLDQHRTEGGSKNIIDYASQSGRLDIIQYMVERNRSEGFSGLAINWAVAKERVDIVEYLTLHLPRDRRMIVSEAINNACHVGRVDMLDWLINQGYQLNEQNCMLASIGNGKVNIVQYLVERKNIQVTLESIYRAIEMNRAEVLEYLFSSPTTSDHCRKLLVTDGENDQKQQQQFSKVMDRAAAMGNLEVIQFINQHFGVKWTHDAIMRAGSQAHLPTFIYLLQNSPKFYLTEEILCSILRVAAQYGRFHFIIFLHQLLTKRPKDFKHIDLEKCFEYVFHYTHNTSTFHIIKYLIDNRIISPLRMEKLVNWKRQRGPLLEDNYDYVMDYLKDYTIKDSIVFSFKGLMNYKK